MTAKQIEALSKKRAATISKLLEDFEKALRLNANVLAAQILKEVLANLDISDGNISLNDKNILVASNVYATYEKFQSSNNSKVLNNFLKGLISIADSGDDYYKYLGAKKNQQDEIRKIIYDRIGINEDGSLKRGGYFKSIVDDRTARNEIQQAVVESIITEKGYENTRKDVRELIEGSDGEMGVYESYYRNIAYDTHVQIDRMNSLLYAEKLKLTNFIYQGTRREHSRHFCIERKGKVFNLEETEEWRDLIDKFDYVEGKVKDRIKRYIGPIVGEKSQSTEEKKENYNPVIEMGGYGCVDIPSFIPDAMVSFFKK